MWSMCEWSNFFGFAILECASGPIFTTPKCASATLANVREWSGFHNTGMCEYLFGQCASGPVIMCEYGDVRMIGYVQVEMCECE